MSVQSRVGVYSDHRSLEYFMTTKLLTAKQVRWMEFLSDFNFQIMFTAGKNNQKADILSQREQDVATQELAKRDSRSCTLLGPARLDPRISADLAQTFISVTTPTLMQIDPDTPPTQSLDSLELIKELHKVNRQSFQSIRSTLPAGYSVEDGLLLH